MSDIPDTLISARWYLERGLSVVPIIPQKKRPAVAWIEYQKRYATQEELSEWFTKGDMWVGLVTGRISQISVLDIDSTEAEESLVHLLNKDVWHSPTVKSRSGGKHVYFAHREKVGSPTGILPGVDVRGEGGIVVVPPSPGYEWINSFDTEPLQPLPDEIVELCTKAMRSRKEVTRAQEKTPIFSDGRRDDDMYSLALHLLRGGWSEEKVLELLLYLANTWGDNVDDPEILHWIGKKVASAVGRARRTGTLADEVRMYVEGTEGWFSLKDLYADLSTVEKSDKAAARKELQRMTERMEIERDRGKSGVYRRIKKDVQVIDFTKVSPKPLDIIWPFGLEEWVSMYPGNIACLAGSPNAGKTAYALNFIERNMDKWGIDYYSSEMGQSELRLRLEKFRNRSLDQFNFRAFERSVDFADAIDSNRISVIDYLEVHDEFWAVGKMIQAIHEKLDEGIALVLMQKKRGADLGRGAEFGLEKPRLYMTMDTTEENGILRHRLKIIKAKNWAQGCKENPNGLSFDFKLVDGCEFQDERSNALSEILF